VELTVRAPYFPLTNIEYRRLQRGLKAVLHDRPPAHFRPANALEIHEVSKTMHSTNVLLLMRSSQLFLRISPSLPKGFLPAYSPPASTPFTQVTSSALPSMRRDRPAVLVSSTSWTEDEDFSILLDALSIYEHRARAADGSLPHVLMFVTGKGPLRDMYMRKAESLQSGKDDPWLWVRVVSIWLEPKDYPLLLGTLFAHLWMSMD
jgi:beta-1,4-mannosyltransferase